MNQKIVGIKAGSFSLIHGGHINCLRFCKSKVDYLIVLINDDDFIFRKKDCVPLNADHRKTILEELKCVNEVNIFHHATEDIWVKSFIDKRLKKEFGKNSKTIMFHDPKVKEPIPCQSIVDEIVRVPYYPLERKFSVSDIFKTIRESK